jgi:hypothetical protein
MPYGSHGRFTDEITLGEIKPKVKSDETIDEELLGNTWFDLR